VLPGHVWLKQALDSRKFLHVLAEYLSPRIYPPAHFHFEPGLRHQDIPWTTEVLLAERVQYTSNFYDYYIHSESVSHKPDNDDTLMRSARHYMKILEMLDAINQRPDKVRHIAACRWQIAKEGLGIIHTFDSMKDESKKHIIIKEFFDRGIWRLIWKNACTFRLRWRLGRRLRALSVIATRMTKTRCFRQRDSFTRAKCLEFARQNRERINRLELLYTTLLYLIQPLVWLRLLLRSRKAPAYRKRWAERYGFCQNKVEPDGILLHSVSVGETLAAIPLVRAAPPLPFAADHRHHHDADRLRARHVRLRQRCSSRLSALRSACAMNRFLNTVQPKLVS
jgi:hypothetical protein